MSGKNNLSPFKKIRSKASVFVLLLLIATSLGFYMIAIRIMNRHILNEVLTRAESLGRSMASPAGYSLISEDLPGLDTLAFRIKESNPDIEFIAITDIKGKILVHSDVQKMGELFEAADGRVVRAHEDGTVISEDQKGPAGIFEVSSPVAFMNKALGSVILGINKSHLASAQKEARRKLVAVFALILCLGVATSIFLSAFLTRPIRELAAGVAELKEGKRSRPLRVYSADELGRLTQSFNEMTALITAQRDQLSQSAQDLEAAYVSTVRVLTAAIDARDDYTLGHSTRVAQIAVALGREVGLSREEIEDLEVACLFHDVGKIKIPDSILLKQGRLDCSEQREMQRHPEYGAEILAKASSLLKYIPAVRSHHEWYDGTGYPDGLKGDGIPLPAAIISLADVFDAMTSDRPYRRALSEEEARRKIAELAGVQFEPGLTSSYIRLLELRAADFALRPRE
jgi:putative nucleotidyltransferase with HDIG domain